ncbi:MAG: hypothetical protein U5J82_02425 [Desulfobacterales bacterium]|nr:hypothetical protein [Desulfobacterales bacterium]
MLEVKKGFYDLIVIEKDNEEPGATDWKSSLELTEVIRFFNREGDAVIVFSIKNRRIKQSLQSSVRPQPMTRG